MSRIRDFLGNECGATAIEYGLIATAMGVALIGIMPFLATSVTDRFSSIASHISSGT
jgi:pilus assembly protein Flp/PilA